MRASDSVKDSRLSSSTSSSTSSSISDSSEGWSSTSFHRTGINERGGGVLVTRGGGSTVGNLGDIVTVSAGGGTCSDLGSYCGGV